MHRFYSAALGEAGTRVLLAPDEMRHLVRVLRAKPGDEIALFDGSGLEAVARVVSVKDKRAEAEITSVKRAPLDVKVAVTVATAIPKGPRMADLVRACTEVGVARIQAMVTERAVVRPRVPGPSERLLRVAREAARQSRRAHVAEIMPVATFDEVLASAPGDHDFTLIADPSPDAEGLRTVLAGKSPARAVIVMIGPEGGFTPGEIERAREKGCLRARLDCPVMRVETAAAVFAAVVIHACS